VLAASDPKDAIRLASEYQGPIHLLMSDVIMPGMSGQDVWVAVGAERPEMKCLFVSGYPASEIAHHGVLDKGVSFLHKPFPPAALAAKVAEILTSTPSKP
jgi:YesN/AraC family two-component response regulator